MKKKLFLLSSLLVIPVCTLINTDATGAVTSRKVGIDNVEIYSSNVLYAANNGSSKGDGSPEHPYDVQTAINKAKPGYEIIVKNGLYEFDRKIEIYAVDGTKNKRITLRAEEDGKVTFNYDKLFNDVIEVGGYQKLTNTITEVSEGDAAARGIQINRSYWTVRGINIDSAGDNGIYIAGHYNEVINCTTTRCRDTGIQLGRDNSESIDISSWPCYNLIKNCTSYNNDDYTGENADGFACKLTTGVGNVFDGCISYNNSDDGWDLYTKNSDTYKDMMIGAVTIKNCIAFNHGRTTDGSSKSAGDGNGFKLGGEKINGNHIIENSLSFNNTCHGFTDNSNPGTITVKNCTGYNNGISPEETKSNFDFARFDYETDKNASSLTSNNYLVNNISFSEKIKNKNIDGEEVDVIAIPDKYNGTAENTLFSRYGFLFKFTEPDICNHNKASNRGERIQKVFKGTDIFESTTLPWTTEELRNNPGIVDEMWRDENGDINLGDFLKVKESFLLEVGMTNLGAVNLHK